MHKCEDCIYYVIKHNKDFNWLLTEENECSLGYAPRENCLHWNEDNYKSVKQKWYD